MPRRRTTPTPTPRAAIEVPTRFRAYANADEMITDTRARLARLAETHNTNAETWTNAAKRYAKSIDPDFYGAGADFNHIEELADAPAPDTIHERAEKIADEISDGLTAREARRKWTHTEDGTDLDAARLLDFMNGNGNARFFRTRRRVYRPARLATIVYPASLSCGYTATDYQTRGAEAAAAVAALESRGFSTAIILENSDHFYKGGQSFKTHSFVFVKRHGEPLDLAALWYSFRPEFSRRAAFMDYIASAGEKFIPTENLDGLGRPTEAGKKAACDFLGLDPAQVIYYPHGITPETMRGQLINQLDAMQRGEAAPDAQTA